MFGILRAALGGTRGTGSASRIPHAQTDSPAHMSPASLPSFQPGVHTPAGQSASLGGWIQRAPWKQPWGSLGREFQHLLPPWPHKGGHHEKVSAAPGNRRDQGRAVRAGLLQANTRPLLSSIMALSTPAPTPPTGTSLSGTFSSQSDPISLPTSKTRPHFLSCHDHRCHLPHWQVYFL